MKPSLRSFTFAIWIASAAFLAGCASSRVNVAVVSQTLQTYQVGRTTFWDFKRDAVLTLVVRTNPAVQHPTSYLTPTNTFTDILSPTPVKYYASPKGSPWKIYETQETRTSINGRSKHTWKFVVGDLNRPISILTFDSGGALTEISPVP
jgi:hypothetical protein